MMDDLLRNISMREELRRLLIPLLQRCMDEDPKDIIKFCTRYFQDLLDARNKSGLKKNEEGVSSDERLKSRCAGSIEKKPALQGSTSLPILNEDPSAKCLQLRETSSWDEGSSFSQTQPQSRKCVMVTEPEIQIGDQLSVADEFTEAEDIDGKNKGEGWKSEVVASSILNAEKHEDGNNRSENKEKSTEVSNAHLPSYSNKVCTLSPLAEKFEDEFDYLVRAALSSHPKTPESTRKKWKIEDDAHWQFARELQLSESNIADSDDASEAHTFKESGEVVALSKKESEENMSLNTSLVSFGSFGFIPKLEIDFDKLVNPRSMESGTSVGDIEILVKSVTRALQELIHVLCASRLYFDDKLDKIKQVSGSSEGTGFVEKQHTSSRKKRSAATFPVSDVKPQSKKNNRRPNKEDSKSVTNWADEKIHPLEETIRAQAEKISKSSEYSENRSINYTKVEGFPEQKEDYVASEKVSASSDVTNEKLPMKQGKVRRREKSQAKRSEEAPRDAQPQIEKFESKEIIYGNRTEECKSESHTSDISDYKYGTNSEFELPDENIPYRSWSKKRNSIRHYHDIHPNPQFENRQYPRQARCPNESKPFNLPHGTYTRGQGRSFNNRPPRHQFRGGQISSRQRSGPSGFLEGGDVLQVTTYTQRTIGTETDFSHARGHLLNSNARPKMKPDSTQSSTGHASSGTIEGHCIKVPEKNSIEKETIKCNMLSSVNETVDSSVSPQKEPKTFKPIDISPKRIDRSCKPPIDRSSKPPIDKSSKPPIDKFSKPPINKSSKPPMDRPSKSVDKSSKPPIDKSFKPIDSNNEKSEPKFDPLLQNPLKHAPDRTQENVEQDGKSVINLNRPISVSSLNPGAKSFNPTNFMRAKGNVKSHVKSPENQALSRRGWDTLETTDAFRQSKDSELSGGRNYDHTTKKFLPLIKSSESEVTSEEDGTANNSKVPNLENGHSDRNKNMFSRGFNSRTHESNQGTDISNPLTNGLANRSAKDIGFKEIINKKPCSYSHMKTDYASNGNEESEHENSSSKQELELNSACGDFVVIDESDIALPPYEGQEGAIPRVNSDIQVRFSRCMGAQDESTSGSVPQESDRSAPKEEPGLSSAGGDFATNGNDDVAQPPPEPQEGIDPSSNMLNQVPLSSSMDVQNRDVSTGSVQEIENQRANTIEEIELNFTCFSDSETSELDSDLSEEYSHNENNAEPDS